MCVNRLIRTSRVVYWQLSLSDFSTRHPISATQQANIRLWWSTLCAICHPSTLQSASGLPWPWLPLSTLEDTLQWACSSGSLVHFVYEKLDKKKSVTMSPAHHCRTHLWRWWTENIKCTFVLGRGGSSNLHVTVPLSRKKCIDTSRWVLGCTAEDKFSWPCKVTQWNCLYFRCDRRTTQTLYHYTYSFMDCSCL